MLNDVAAVLIAALLLTWLLRGRLVAGRGRTGLLAFDALWTAGLAAILVFQVAHWEWAWVDGAHHSVAQSITLIDKGHADGARQIYLDHLAFDLDEHRAQFLMQIVILVVAGGAVGFRFGRSRSQSPTETA